MVDAYLLFSADWSRVHGFFAVMGGFVSHDGKKMLSRQDIEELVRNEQIVYPIVSKEEIKDRSKGDAVTKALVLSQTTWFLLQCAARGGQRLALTELELATAAFALVNIIIYALWWDKPLDVQCPIRVRRRRRRKRTGQTSQGNSVGVSQDQNQEASEPPDGSSCGLSWSDVFQAIGNVLLPFASMTGDDDTDNDAFFVVGDGEAFDDSWDYRSIPRPTSLRRNPLRRLVIPLPLVHRTTALADILSRDHWTPIGNAEHCLDVSNAWHRRRPNAHHHHDLPCNSLPRFSSRFAGLVSHYSPVSPSLSIPDSAMDDFPSPRVGSILYSIIRISRHVFSQCVTHDGQVHSNNSRSRTTWSHNTKRTGSHSLSANIPTIPAVKPLPTPSRNTTRLRATHTSNRLHASPIYGRPRRPHSNASNTPSYPTQTPCRHGDPLRH